MIKKRIQIVRSFLINPFFYFFCVGFVFLAVKKQFCNWFVLFYFFVGKVTVLFFYCVTKPT